MRVLVLTNLYPPHALGGYEMSCRDVVDRWRASGHEVEVLTTDTAFHDRAVDPPEPHVHRDLRWYWHDHLLLRPPPRRRVALERHNRARLQQVLLRLRPEVVSAWAMGGMSMGLLTACVEQRLPLVLVVEDEWLTYAPRIDAWTSAWLRRPRAIGAVAARLTGLPTAVPDLRGRAVPAYASEFLRRRAAAGSLVPVDEGVVVPLGTDPVDFPLRPASSRAWSGRLLAVGRVEPRKGFDIAVRALAELPGATLRIAGAGDDRHLADLLSLAGELGVADRVSAGPVPREDLAATYAGADALLFLSRWDEPFGLVPLEAMSQGTPVVATRRGGSAEFLTGGDNCLEVPVDDPAAVATAVRRLAGDERLRRRLAEGGAVTTSRFRVDRFATDLEEIHLDAAKVVA